MLKVDQYSFIRTAHQVYGKTIKQIARETGHSRNTIKRVLRGEYGGYKAREHQPYPVLGPHIEVIDKWIGDDKSQPRKQRHTAVRVVKSAIFKIPMRSSLLITISSPDFAIQAQAMKKAAWSLVGYARRNYMVPMPKVKRVVLAQ